MAATYLASPLVQNLKGTASDSAQSSNNSNALMMGANASGTDLDPFQFDR